MGMVVSQVCRSKDEAMKEGPLGIYYLDYCEKSWPKSARKMIFGYTKKQFLKSIKEHNIPNNYFCWLSECRTPGYLVEGNIEKVSKWISKHIPNKYGDPLNGR